MRRAFLEFLTSAEIVPEEHLGRLENLLRRAPEPIGSIAFSYGMIGGADIDVVLDEQRTDHRQFGEIAISKGLLDREQVETLLAVQQIRAATETAEALALSGICPLERVVTQFGRFLSQYQDSLTCT